MRTQEFPSYPAVTTRRLRGFSLVELMVGLTVGIIALLVMAQMLSSSETQKRTTLGADDAQNSGVVALDTLQREIRQSGFGIDELRILACQLQWPDLSTTPYRLAPVTINPGTLVMPDGDANSDTLLVIYGNSNGGTQGLNLFNPADLEGVTSDIAVIRTATVNENYYLWGFPTVVQGDWIIPDGGANPGVPISACNVALPIRRVSAINFFPQAAAPAPTQAVGFLFNLGPARPGVVTPSLQVLAYAVRNNNLTVCDYMVNNCAAACTAADGTCSAAWVPVASNIASLRAQYGRDTNAVPNDLDGMVDTFDQTTPTTGCGWGRVMAIRLALVAQSAQSAAGVITAAAPTWAGTTSPTPVLIDLTGVRTAGGGLTWQNYRYKVFETTIPLRNNPAWTLVRLRDHSRPDYREPTGCAS